MASTETNAEVFTIKAEPLTREAFAPFGKVLGLEGEERLPIDLYDKIDVYRPARIVANTETEWLVNRTGIREMRLHYLERHEKLAQAFIPLGGVGFVSVLAPADATLVDGIPALDEIRAFVVPGDRGIQIDLMVWHEPPFGIEEDSVQIITSHQDLTRGLGAELDERKEIDQLDVDKRNVTERTGKIVRIELP